MEAGSSNGSCRHHCQSAHHGRLWLSMADTPIHTAVEGSYIRSRTWLEFIEKFVLALPEILKVP